LQLSARRRKSPSFIMTTCRGGGHLFVTICVIIILICLGLIEADIHSRISSIEESLATNGMVVIDSLYREYQPEGTRCHANPPDFVIVCDSTYIATLQIGCSTEG